MNNLDGVSSTNQANRELRVVAVLFFTWGSVFLARMSGLYLAPYIALEFQLTHAQVGMLSSVLAITWAFSGLFLGSLSDHIGRRVILIPCAFSFSILCMASGLVHSFNQLLLLRGLMGVALGPTWPILNAMVKDSSSPATRGRNVGAVVSAAALVGLTMASLLATQVAARFNWRWAFLAAGIPGLVMSFLVLKYAPESELASSRSSRLAAWREFSLILRQPNIWLCCLGTAGFMCWLFITHTFAPLYMIEVAHQAPTTAGWLIAATGLGSFLLGFILPGISDRIGRRLALMIMATLSVAVPLLLLVSRLYQHLWLLAALLLVANAGQGVSALIMVLIPSESVRPEFAATAIALTTFVGELVGATVAPWESGRLAQSHGLGITLWIAGAGMMLVLLLSTAMKETSTAVRAQSVRLPGTSLSS